MQHRGEWTREERLVRLRSLQELVQELEKEHRRLWRARNRPGGLERSLSGLVRLRSGIDDEQRRQQQSAVMRGLRRLGEKLEAGGVDLLLRLAE